MYAVRLNKNNNPMKVYTDEKRAFKDAYAYVKKNPSKYFIMNIYKTKEDYEKGNTRVTASVYVRLIDGVNKICAGGWGSFLPNILNPDGSLGAKVKRAVVLTPRGRFLGYLDYTVKPYPKKYDARDPRDLAKSIGVKDLVGNEKIEEGDYKWLYISNFLKTRTKR